MVGEEETDSIMDVSLNNTDIKHQVITQRTGA